MVFSGHGLLPLKISGQPEHMHSSLKLKLDSADQSMHAVRIGRFSLIPGMLKSFLDGVGVDINLRLRSDQ